jgi:short subunit dehydrogenase-like uncharacterized protein
MDVVTGGMAMIYGATGHSGRLVTRRLCELGVRPVLCGRDAGKLAPLAESLDLEHRVAATTDPAALDGALENVRVVLNAAGPFSQTAEPIADACLRAGAHYLDITAELPSIEAICRRNDDARRRSVMLMPAVGFDVVPTDCLAAHVARRLPGTRRLAIAVTNLFFLTRGSAKTLVENVNRGVVRSDGGLTPAPLGSIERSFDFGRGPTGALNVSLGDLITAYYSTGVPNVETYVEATPLMRALLGACRAFGWLLDSAPAQAWLTAWSDVLPADPGSSEGRAMVVVAEAEDDRGRRASARLQTPEAYEFTGITAAAIVNRVLDGDVEPGFQTPSRVYGRDFVLGFADVVREDVE